MKLYVYIYNCATLKMMAFPCYLKKCILQLFGTRNKKISRQGNLFADRNVQVEHIIMLQMWYLPSNRNGRLGSQVSASGIWFYTCSLLNNKLMTNSGHYYIKWWKTIILVSKTINSFSQLNNSTIPFLDIKLNVYYCSREACLYKD